MARMARPALLLLALAVAAVTAHGVAGAAGGAGRRDVGWEAARLAEALAAVQGDALPARAERALMPSPGVTPSVSPRVSPSSAGTPAVTPSASVSATPSATAAATSTPTPTPTPFHCPGEVFAAGYGSDADAAAARGDATLYSAVTSLAAARTYAGVVVDDAACSAAREAAVVSWTTLAAQDPEYGYHEDAASEWGARAPPAAGLATSQSWRRVAVCSGHGSCTRDGAAPTGGSCACAWGFAGASCSTCVPGFHLKRVCATCATTLSTGVASALGAAVAATPNATVGAAWQAWLTATALPGANTTLPHSATGCGNVALTCSGATVAAVTLPAGVALSDCSPATAVLATAGCGLPPPALAAAAPWWWHGAGSHAPSYGVTGSVAGNGACTAADGSGVCAASIVDAVSGGVTCPTGFSRCAGDALAARGTPTQAVAACVPCGGSRLVSLTDTPAAVTVATAPAAYGGTVCSGHGMCVEAEGGVWPPATPAAVTGAGHLGAVSAVASWLDTWRVTEAQFTAAAQAAGVSAANASTVLPAVAAALLAPTGASTPQPGSAAGGWQELTVDNAGGGAWAPAAMHTGRGRTDFLRDVAAPLNLTWLFPFLASHAVIGGGQCSCVPGWAGPDCGVHVASGEEVVHSTPLAGGAGGAVALNATAEGAVDGFPPLVALAACSGDVSCSGHGACAHSGAYQAYRLVGALPAKSDSVGIETAVDTFLNPDRSDRWPSTLAACVCVGGWAGDRCHIPLTNGSVADGGGSVVVPAGTSTGTGATLAVPLWGVAAAWSDCSASCNAGSQTRAVSCSARGADVLRAGSPAALCQAALYEGPTRGSDSISAASTDADAEVYLDAGDAGVPSELLPPVVAVNGSCSLFVRPGLQRICRNVPCGAGVANITLPLSGYSAAVTSAVLARAGTLTGAAAPLTTDTARYGAAYSYGRVTGGAGAALSAALHVLDDGRVAEAWVTAVAVDLAATLGVSVSRIQITDARDRAAATVAVAGSGTCGGLGAASTCATGVDVDVEVVDALNGGGTTAAAALAALTEQAPDAASALRRGVVSVYDAAVAVRDRSAPAAARRALRALQATDAAGVPAVSLVAASVDTVAVAAASFGGTVTVTTDVAGAKNEASSSLTLAEIAGILVAVLVFMLAFGCGMYYLWLCSVRSDPKNRAKYAAIKKRLERAKAVDAAAGKAAKAAAAKAAAQEEGVPLMDDTDGDGEGPPGGEGGAAPSNTRAERPPLGGGRLLGRRGRGAAATSSGDAAASPVVHDGLGGSSSLEAGSSPELAPPAPPGFKPPPAVEEELEEAEAGAAAGTLPALPAALLSPVGNEPSPAGGAGVDATPLLGGGHGNPSEEEVQGAALEGKEESKEGAPQGLGGHLEGKSAEEGGSGEELGGAGLALSPPPSVGLRDSDAAASLAMDLSPASAAVTPAAAAAVLATPAGGEVGEEDSGAVLAPSGPSADEAVSAMFQPLDVQEGGASDSEEEGS